MTARAFPLALACLLAVPSRTAGQDVSLERESLAGLDGLYVLVDDIDEDGQEGGLTRGALRTYLEMRLRQARIPILSEDEFLALERSPRLYLSVTTLSTAAGGWTYSLDLNVDQYACIKGGMEGQGLLALTGGCSMFTTWDTGGSTLRQTTFPAPFAKTWPSSWMNS